MNTINPIPDGFRTLTPSMIIKHAAAAIAFYKRAFGAEELNRRMTPDSRSVMHATPRGSNPVVARRILTPRTAFDHALDRRLVCGQHEHCYQFAVAGADRWEGTRA